MRLFLATSFPESVSFDLNARLQPLKAKLASASWVRPESQHVTFAFLGEQEESLLAMLEPAVTKALAPTSAFPACLRGCGFFPNPRRARVGWVGLDPEEPFVGIANALRDAVRASGVELDRADFRPHLTLMRIRDPWPPACIQTFERALSCYQSEPFLVDKVTLYASKLNPKGAVHSAVSEFPLA